MPGGSDARSQVGAASDLGQVSPCVGVPRTLIDAVGDLQVVGRRLEQVGGDLDDLAAQLLGRELDGGAEDGAAAAAAGAEGVGGLAGVALVRR